MSSLTNLTAFSNPEFGMIRTTAIDGEPCFVGRDVARILGYANPNDAPKANKKAEGLFEVKQCSNQKTKWAGCQTLITPKGVETFKLLCQGL
jgi:prophage antirepressor-like protein